MSRLLSRELCRVKGGFCPTSGQGRGLCQVGGLLSRGILSRLNRTPQVL